MTSKAEISIWDAGSGAVLVRNAQVTLPAELGRVGPDSRARLSDSAGQEIVFGADYNTLSRQHLTMKPSPDGTVLVTDTSINGVAVVMPGRPSRPLGTGNSDRVPAGGVRHFETVGLVVELTLPRAAPPAEIPAGADTGLYAVYESRSGRNKPLPIATGTIALLPVGPEVQVERRMQATAEAAMSQVSADGLSCICVIGPSAAGGVVAIPGDKGHVTRNRRMLSEGVAINLGHLDTIEAAGIVLRIMQEGGEPALICVNPDCGQMNGYEPGGNCRYCGTRLGDAHTYVLPQEGRA